MPDTHETVTARLRAAGCVFAEEEARLLREAASDAAHLDRLTARRVAGEPLEHLLGWVDFAGLRLEVDPGVFVPRQRTAVLAERTAAVASTYAGPVVVDLCCGCGAIAAVVAERVPGARVLAADIDEVAVANARRNLEPRGARAVAGDLFAPLPRSLAHRIDVLSVNAPYVPTSAIATLPPEAREREPHRALDGGPDGLDVHRRVLLDVRRWLALGARLLIEVSQDQAPEALALFDAAGLDASIEDDPARASTLVVGRLRATPQRT